MPTGEYEMREEDRLPWLETVDDDYDERPSIVRIVLLVMLALAIVAAVILGYRYYQTHRGIDGNGALIAAQEGDYKVKPDDPGGLRVEGEGDSAIATSNGAASGNASIDMRTAPEKPIDGKKVVTPRPDTGASKAIAAIPAAGPRAGSGAGASGGSLVQLGSFDSESEADMNWSAIARKYGYVASLGKSVQAAEVGGRTVYRLRVNAGSVGQAASLCAKLAAAGQACFVPKS